MLVKLTAAAIILGPELISDDIYPIGWHSYKTDYFSDSKNLFFTPFLDLLARNNQRP